jgi:membrane-bound inhibitor of C-type lysozyme
MRISLKNILLSTTIIFALSACASTEAPKVGSEVNSTKMQYDMNSWKEVIDDQCRSFSDGCNNCVREPGKMAACTRKACAVYQQPRCLDEEASAAKVIEYACDDDSRCSISYHEYHQDDQRLRLQDDEIMFSDRQTHTASRLQRERSASGEKYSNAEGLQFFAKGNEALVMQQGERLYSNCSVQS